MSEALDFTKAAPLPLSIFEKFPFRIELELFENDAITPKEATGEWRMGIANSPEGEAFTFLEMGDGIELAANKVILARDIDSIADGLKTPGKYYYDLRNDISGEDATPVAKDTFTVKQFITPPKPAS